MTEIFITMSNWIQSILTGPLLQVGDMSITVGTILSFPLILVGVFVFFKVWGSL